MQLLIHVAFLCLTLWETTTLSCTTVALCHVVTRSTRNTQGDLMSLYSRQSSLLCSFKKKKALLMKMNCTSLWFWFIFLFITSSIKHYFMLHGYSFYLWRAAYARPLQIFKHCFWVVGVLNIIYSYILLLYPFFLFCFNYLKFEQFSPILGIFFVLF